MNAFDHQQPQSDPDDILDIAVTSRPPAPQQTGTLADLSTMEAQPFNNGAVDRWPGDEVDWDDDVSGQDVSTSDEMAAQEPHWFGMMVRETVETVGLAVIIFLIIRIGIQNYRIEGQSMEPNFHDGEYLIVNKLAYRLGEYERGDVIVFKYPNDPSKDYIKRVIGLPGDTVEIRGGQLYVNNVEIEEPYQHMPNTRDEPPTVVDAGHLYVMGDNRPASSDTRSWGQLGQEFVIGQAWLAIYPFDTAGLVKHQPIEVNAVMAQGP